MKTINSTIRHDGVVDDYWASSSCTLRAPWQIAMGNAMMASLLHMKRHSNGTRSSGARIMVWIRILSGAEHTIFNPTTYPKNQKIEQCTHF
jgi:hypothetical protein